MKIFLYIWNRIVGGNCPMKVETRTPFPILFVLGMFKTGNMKTINLTQGKVALVDDEDYEYLNQWTWCAQKDRNTYYAKRGVNKGNNKTERINMHRLIMNTPHDMFVDHIDHDGLNNQKYNMRNCTWAQNTRNKTASGSSKYLGVCIINGLFHAQICVNRKCIRLGDFIFEEDAARAYDEAANQYFGEFANLNFK
jgi:hypothetical protein